MRRTLRIVSGVPTTMARHRSTFNGGTFLLGNLAKTGSWPMAGCANKSKSSSFKSCTYRSIQTVSDESLVLPADYRDLGTSAESFTYQDWKRRGGRPQVRRAD
jgi:hypothetical protein